MSQTAVLNYVETRIETIAGIDAGTLLRCEQGLTILPQDAAEFPVVTLATRNLEGEQITAGTGGTYFENYAVVVTLYLGTRDLMQDTAIARSKLFPSRFRAVFASDWKLGGACYNAELRGPADNLAASPTSGVPQYQETQAYPILQWALMVTEQTAANAAAS